MNPQKKIIIFFITLFPVFMNIDRASAQDTARQARTSAYYLEKGRLQFMHEMYDFSIENLQRALEMDGTLYEAANMLGKIYIIKNDRAKGIKYFIKSLEINSNQPDIHCAAGELYDFFSENDLAFSHFREAVKINPGHLKANLNLVRYYIMKKDRAAADKHFRASYDAGLAITKELYARSRKLYREKQYDKAIVLLNECISDNPSMIEAYEDLFAIYRETDRAEKAAGIMERLKFLKPDYERAYINLGHIYFTKRLPGKRKFYLDRAISNYRKAIELNPDNYETYYLLSHVYFEIGDYDLGKELEKTAEAVEKAQGNKKK